MIVGGTTPLGSLAIQRATSVNAAGRVVREPSALQPGDSFQTRFRRGRITGTVVSVDPDAPHAKS